MTDKMDLNKMFFENPTLYNYIVNKYQKKKQGLTGFETDEQMEGLITANTDNVSTSSQPFEVKPELENWFDLKKVVVMDLETSNGKGGGSLDAHDPDSFIALVQTEIDGEIKVQKWSPEVAEWIKSLDEQGYTFVFHNGAFDLYFLRMKSNLELTHVFDTMIASQVINAGKVTPDAATRVSAKVEGRSIDNVGVYDSMFEEDDEYIVEKAKNVSRYSHNLAATVYRYARATVKKDQGNSDWGAEVLTEDQIRYAEEDVRYLRRVMLNQLFYGAKFKTTKVLKLEMELLPAVVDMRYNGILIDRQGWLKAIEGYAKEAKLLEAELNNSIGLELSIKYGDDINGMFGAVPRKFSVKSNAQILEFFKDEHLEGEPIKDVSEMTLRKLKHPIIPKILKFKEVDKLATTYGEGYLKHIRSDGRIHAELKQTSSAQGNAIATGRFASANPNLQNIPVDLIKNLLRVNEGYRLITCDYSSVEARILAYAADDVNYINSVNSTDVHWENAKKMFHLPDDAPKDAKLRTKAKIITFSIPYGASAMGIWQKGNTETLEEAEELVKAFFASFPQVKKFLDNSVVDALTRGYTQDFYGRIRWYEIPDRGTASEKVIKSAQKAAARQAQNHPIQSLSASTTKMAIKNLYKLLREKGWGYMILTIHDSIFFEIKEEFVDVAIPSILKVMEDSAREIMPVLKAPADVDVGEKITKIDPITGNQFKVYSHTWDSELQKAVPNDDVYDPDTVRIAKELKADLKDPMGAAVDMLSKIETQTVEWQQKNMKFIQQLRTVMSQ